MINAEDSKAIIDPLMAISTLALAVFTAFLAYSTRAMAKATQLMLEEAREASFRQIRVQMWLEFQKRFDSEPMVAARRILAQQIQARPSDTSNVSETVPNFFEDVGMAFRNGYLEKTLAAESFGFYLCRWWEALGPYIATERRRHDEDSTLFEHFEALSKIMRTPDETINEQKLRGFIEDESRLV